MKSLSHIQFLLLALLALSLYSSAYGMPNIARYDLKFRIDYKERKLFCRAEISLKETAKNDTLELLLYRLMKVRSIRDDHGRSVRFDQAVVSFLDRETLQVNHILVFVGEARTQKVIIEYEGFLFGYTETGMLYVKDNINPDFTILRMDSYAYPVRGTISRKKNRAAGLPTFDYTISISVPDTLMAVNGGKLISQKKHDGFTDYVYQNIKPAWRIDLTISKYRAIVEKEFMVYHFPQDSTGAQYVADAVRNSLSLFRTWFGDIGFPGYSVIEIPDNWGSQTDVTSILLTAASFKEKERLFELYHEISHVWNVSSLDQNPCRLESEGLAVCLQYLVSEKLENKPATLDSGASRMFRWVKKYLARDTVASNTPIINFGETQLTDLSYSKGMLFFYLLYKQVGEDEFLKTMRGFYQVYRNHGATTQDFAKYFVKNIKNSKVERLVDDWIFSNKSSAQIRDSKSVQDLQRLTFLQARPK